MDNTIQEIEETMAEIMVNWLPYHRVVAEYYRLLKIMGNVDGDEVITLVLVAAAAVDALDGITPNKS